MEILPISVELESVRALIRGEVLLVEAFHQTAHDGLRRARAVLEQQTCTGAQRLLGQPADSGVEFADRLGCVGWRCDGVAARDVDVRQPGSALTLRPAWATSSSPSAVSIRVTVVRVPEGRITTSSPGTTEPAAT